VVDPSGADPVDAAPTPTETPTVTSEDTQTETSEDTPTETRE